MYIIIADDDLGQRGVYLSSSSKYEADLNLKLIRKKNVQISEDDKKVFDIYQLVQLGSNISLIEDLMLYAYKMGQADLLEQLEKIKKG